MEIVVAAVIPVVIAVVVAVDVIVVWFGGWACGRWSGSLDTSRGVGGSC